MNQDCSSPAVNPEPSPLPSSTLDDEDSEILSLVRGCPSSLENICNRTGISTEECLRRVENLKQRNLIRELEGPGRPSEIRIYLATVHHS
ncbi:MAG: hypothetical protein ACE5KV_08720 [Thermoplasmata archaeon]